ncbi:hypothetical protein C7293_14040 [filamentous cyanobacterium CCT1]|nr:hypothetical protein C7293_14040 [filamentous cyanobacterium CCT1]PSN75694.1 hypothetical protein C8B47_31220 [filamentous cyanobacterium CCP4]
MTHSTTPRVYLIGLSTFQRQPLLGDYEQDSLRLNDCGLIVADEWVRSAANRKGIAIDTWSITPNRLQSIVLLQGPSPTASFTGGVIGGSTGSLGSQKPWLLSSFIASFKAAAAKRINLRLNQVGQLVWQRSYDENLITDAAHLSDLRQQLQANPSRPAWP